MKKKPEKEDDEKVSDELEEIDSESEEPDDEAEKKKETDDWDMDY